MRRLRWDAKTGLCGLPRALLHALEMRLCGVQVRERCCSEDQRRCKPPGLRGCGRRCARQAASVRRAACFDCWAAAVDTLRMYRVRKLQSMGVNGWRTAHNMPTKVPARACGCIYVCLCECMRVYLFACQPARDPLRPNVHCAGTAAGD